MSLGLKLTVAVLVLMALTGIGLIAYGLNRTPGSDGAPGSENQEDAQPFIEHAWHRKTSEFDPGSLRVYLRNPGSAPLKVEKVLVDGLPIPVWGVDWVPTGETKPAKEEPDTEHKEPTLAEKFAAKRVVWARLEPSPVPEGAIAELTAKLSAPLTRPMKAEVVLASGTALSTVIRPVPPQIAITAITFSARLDEMYVYFEGSRNGEVLEIAGIEVNGRNAVDESLWLSSRSAAPGEKQLAIVRPKKPFDTCQPVTVMITAKDGAIAEDRVRAVSGFPISVDGAGHPPGDFGLDAQPYTVRPTYFDAEDVPSVPNVSHDYANQLFECHMHKYAGDRTRCAEETLRRLDLCRRADPGHPTYVHLCRIRPETGYALFGEIADILRINPNVNSGLSKGNEGESPWETAARIASFARLAASPKPFHALADTSKFGDEKRQATPAEFRRRTFTILAEGAKALLYRHSGWDKEDDANKALHAEIRRINAELRWVRNDLAVADVVSWVAGVDRPDVTVKTLLAANRTLLMVSIKKEQMAEPDSPAVSMEKFQVRLNLPAWVKSATLCKVTQAERTNAGVLECGKSETHVDLPVPEAASIHVIELNPVEANAK